MSWLFVSIVVLLIIYGLFQYFVVKWRSQLVSAADKKFFNQHWQNILAEKDGRHQLILADKLLDQMLLRRGFQGSLGDKLKKAAKKFTQLNDLWTAHKLRNKIAHEVGFSLSESQRLSSIKAFKVAFKDLGLLN